MSSLRTKALKYTLLPGILPRLQGLFSEGFATVAFLIALIYQGVRLLPPNHPYLNAANKGSYGVRHVIAAAANNLKFNKKNIDQVIMFFTILSGIVILFIQVALFAITIFLQNPVSAQTTASNIDSISFSIQNLFGVDSEFGHGGNDISRPSSGGGPATNYNSAPQDLAFVALDRIFGIPNIFDSCVSSTDIPCFDISGNELSKPDTFPTRFHEAFHALLGFYSYGLFFVGVFIIIYFVTTIVAETAVSGTPFGQRMNKAWTPVRLLLFLGLLIPISSGDLKGINLAQYGTLWTAKIGSNFATNGWGLFTHKVLLKSDRRMLASPEIPNYKRIAEMLFLMRACQIVEQQAVRTRFQGDSTTQSLSQLNLEEGHFIAAYQVRDTVPEKDSGAPASPHDDLTAITLTTSFDAAREFSGNQDIIISIGYEDTENKSTVKHAGNITPQCGQFVIPIRGGSRAYLRLAEGQYNGLVEALMMSGTMNDYVTCVLQKAHNTQNIPECAEDMSNADMIALITDIEEIFKNNIRDALDDVETDDYFKPEPNQSAGTIPNDSYYHDVQYMIAKGWAGAGLWYNRIAEMNGDISDGVNIVPQLTHFPAVMEHVAQYKKRYDEEITEETRFKPVLSDGREIGYVRPEIDTYIAPVLYRIYNRFDKMKISEPTALTGNPFTDFINFLFGTEGIFDMRKRVQTEYGEQAPHPMAQLSALGKSMMTASLRNIAGGYGGEILGSILGMANSDSLKSLTGFFISIGQALLALSFVLFYVLPFLPFIYFMFALSNWVKSIFEAIVAMPLWALAHLRIDGEGIPGTDAANGYYLVFEIFLRPILIVFGLSASIIIFQSMAEILNQVFDVIIGAVGGSNTASSGSSGLDNFANSIRGPIDEFFYTALYVVIIYMIALSSFKLIDLIPNQIMRWVGANVSAFQETAGDPAGQLTGSTFQGTTLLTGNLKGGQVAALISS
ncbi:MAG: DotA/TraY family protein [Pseudomonadota bacterium]